MCACSLLEAREEEEEGETLSKKKALIYCNDIRENIEHREGKWAFYSININRRLFSSFFFAFIQNASNKQIIVYSSANLMTFK
jgi:hypothetical protein